MAASNEAAHRRRRNIAICKNETMVAPDHLVVRPGPGQCWTTLSLPRLLAPLPSRSPLQIDEGYGFGEGFGPWAILQEIIYVTLDVVGGLFIKMAALGASASTWTPTQLTGGWWNARRMDCI